MSDANRVNFAYYKETDFGVIPDPAPTLKDFLRISDSFGQNPTTQISTTLRSDRSVQDIIRKNIAPAGDVAFNFSYGACDDLIEGVMMDTWSADLALSGNIAVVDTGQKFTSDSTGGGPDFTTVVVGQWIKVAGLVADNNNGYFRVISKDVSVPAAMEIGVAGSGLTDAAAAAGTIKGSVIFNGITPTSFGIEKAFLDLSNVFDAFVGVRVGGFDLNIKTAEPINGAFHFMGKSAGGDGSATLGTGTNTGAPENQEMNANDHVAMVYQDNELALFSAMEFSFKLSNALRQKGRIALFGPFDIGVGRMTIEATLNAYFEDRVLLDKARAFENIGFAFRLQDEAGNAYVIDLPRTRISGGDPAVTGIDTDVAGTYKVETKIDPIALKMVSISRFPAA